MMMAMRGTLTEDPRMTRHPGLDGFIHRGINAKLKYADNRPGSVPGRCELIAWNEQADALIRYRKGDELEFIGELNSNFVGKHDTLSFTLISIDETRTIVSAQERFLSEYTPPKEHLTDRIHRAEQQKDSQATSGFSGPQKEATQ